MNEIIVGNNYGSKHPIPISVRVGKNTLFLDMRLLEAKRLLLTLSLDDTRTDYFETKQCNNSLVLRVQEICSLKRSYVVLAYLCKSVIAGERIELYKNGCNEFKEKLVNAIRLDIIYQNGLSASTSQQIETIDAKPTMVDPLDGAKKRMNDNLRDIFG